MSVPFTVVARMRARAGCSSELRAALEDLVVATRAESGCLNYDLHVGVDDPDLFVFHENWVDRDAHRLHDQTAHVARFRELAAELVDGTPVVDGLTRVD